MRWAPVTLPLLLLGFTLGCIHTIRPRPELPSGETFSHARLDAVQQRFVNGEGRVDYPGLVQDRGDLDAYYRQLAGASPKSHPEFFPTRDDQLTYWINAYNGAVLVAVADAWPVSSVGDVKPPLLLRPVLRGRSTYAGFFVFQKVELGGQPLNLYDLENEIIRPYDEPRIHFAINCASIGCPFLPRRAFRAGNLDAQLDRETRRFFASPEKFRIDHQRRQVHISSILDWFEEDFTGWLARQGFSGEPTLLDYIRLYVPPERQSEIDRARDYEVVFIPYDWGVNAQ